MFKAFTTDRSLLPELLKVDRLPPRALAAVREYDGRRAAPETLVPVTA